MHFVFFVHPSFLLHKSMPRYARMIMDGLKERGHTVEVWSPKARAFTLPAPKAVKKWLGYIDQYILFPQEVRSRLKGCSPDTFFVVTDNALGPWVPLIADRLHAIHCHDFIAQRSALGEILEHKTSWTGQQYQAFIRRGYLKGRHFICVSQQTKDELIQMLAAPPARADVVYNSLDESFQPLHAEQARVKLGNQIGVDLTSGYLLHIGGNFWYKNRTGVIEMYDAWRSKSRTGLPLLLVGEDMGSGSVGAAYARSPYRKNIHFVSDLSNESVRQAYAGAQLLLFPSMAEGFGWPIIEAMSMKCPVLTTSEAPMTEVAGKAAFLVPRRPSDANLAVAWATSAADVIERILTLPPPYRQQVIEEGLTNVQRFDYEQMMDQLERIYQEIAHSSARFSTTEVGNLTLS